ncbi:MAG: ribonuclease PH [Gemmatimonadetes bacterium]|nr:ribonuclease PH [Gemmatimonadota bacterium]MEE2880085.1 ribonuclease PH [Gemmatimonadota bacterium]
MVDRSEGRNAGQLRKLDIKMDVAPFAEGSCLISTGQTRVLCTASVQEEVPSWREKSGKGWVTAEYSMLPRATHTRTRRERGRVSGRTQEIQRLIGRALRSVVDMEVIAGKTVIVDCDVIQADGGTRTACVTGATVALGSAFDNLVREGLIDRNPMSSLVAGVSVGIVRGQMLLDLDYSEDSAAQVDLNVIATAKGELVEVQGTAEGQPFSRDNFDELLDMALSGIEELTAFQRQLFTE